MQTFLPYHSFRLCARVLDYRRLGKQRVECKQILRALGAYPGDDAVDTPRGWANHPATKMWKGYEQSLIEYSNAMICEWVRRGYNNSMPVFGVKYAPRPWWMKGKVWAKVREGHRSNLTRKDPEHYSDFWATPPTIDYHWPV